MVEESFIVGGTLQVQDDLSLVSELFRLSELEVLSKFDVKLEILHMAGLDVVGEVLADLMNQEVRQGELKGLVFSSKDILLDDSDDFPEGSEVDDIVSVLIEVFEELEEVLMESFAVGSDESLKFLVDVRGGDEESVDVEGQGIDGLGLLLLHMAIVD